MKTKHKTGDDKSTCDIDECPEKAFVTEKLTGTDMKLCKWHFLHYFRLIAKDAEVEDTT